MNDGELNQAQDLRPSIWSWDLGSTALRGSSAHGQVSFGNDAAIADELAWRLERFDHWLKGIDNDVSARKRLLPRRCGSSSWGSVTGTRRRRDCSTTAATGATSRSGPSRAPLHPVRLPENGGLQLRLNGQAIGPVRHPFHLRSTETGPYPGRQHLFGEGTHATGRVGSARRQNFWNAPEPIPLSARNDILVFRTPPLPADLEVTGEITVQLWASSLRVDTDFTAKLIDVYPPSADYPGGFDLNLEDGIVRARFARDSLKEEKLMTPGTILPVHDQALPDVQRI